jgi:hypothetical protein
MVDKSKESRELVLFRSGLIEGSQPQMVEAPDPSPIVHLRGQEIDVIDRPDELDECEQLQVEPLAMAVVGVRDAEFYGKDPLEVLFDKAGTADTGVVTFSSVKGHRLSSMRFLAGDPNTGSKKWLKESHQKTREFGEEILKRGNRFRLESRIPLGSIKTDDFAIYLSRAVRVIERKEAEPPAEKTPGLVRTTRGLLDLQSPLEIASHPEFRSYQYQARVVVRGDRFDELRKEIVSKLNEGLAPKGELPEPTYLPDILGRKRLKSA